MLAMVVIVITEFNIYIAFVVYITRKKMSGVCSKRKIFSRDLCVSLSSSEHNVFYDDSSNVADY